jgi:hypothetical protein
MLSTESFVSPVKATHLSPLYNTASKSGNLVREIAIKKCKSLEDMQVTAPAVDELSASTEVRVPVLSGRPKTATVKSSRVCGANESFRAAVDRSYDGPDSQEIMDTVEEDLCENEPVYSPTILSTPRSTKDESRPSDSGWNLWKGFTGMFRIGRPKKTEELKKNDVANAYRSPSAQSDIIREVSKTTKFYVPEEFQNRSNQLSNGQNTSRFYDTQQQQWQQQPRVDPSSKTCTGSTHRPAPCVSENGASDTSESSASTNLKIERIQELRRYHQRSHRQRQGRYPHDEQEERFEQQLRALEQRRQDFNLPAVSHMRSQSGPVMQPLDRYGYQHLSQHPSQRTSKSYVDQNSLRQDPKFFAAPSSYLKVTNIVESSQTHVTSPRSPLVTSQNGDTVATSPTYDAVDSVPCLWSRHELSPSQDGALPSSTAMSSGRINLPMRHHLAHIPLTAASSSSRYEFCPQSPTRRSHREPTTEPPIGGFQRFVSLPTRHRRYGAIAAQSAQV